MNFELHQLSHLSTILYALLTLIIITLIRAILSKSKVKRMEFHWDKIAKKKRALRDQQIKDIVLPKINISAVLKEKIINSDAMGLLEMLKNKEATSEQILIILFERTITIGLEHNLITEINFTEALIQAKECDRLRLINSPQCQGVLFGLPMTVKDNIILKGFDCSAGMASKVFQPHPEDGLFCKILKAEGAIIFAKTNVPQAIINSDTNNFIYGQAKNPWNKERSVGGSSGGEGGLLAARCTPLGIGNDLLGSLRIPANNCGVVAFKSSAERLPAAGIMPWGNTFDGVLNIKIGNGPMARSVRDCNLLMKAVLNSNEYSKLKLSERDPYYVRREWNEVKVFARPKGLRIGYFKSMDLIPAANVNQRAVEEAADHLRRRGYELVEVEFPNLKEFGTIIFETMFAEGEGRYLSECLKGEKSIPGHDANKQIAGTPSWMMPILKIMLKLFGENRAADLMKGTRKKSAYEYLNMVIRQNVECQKFFQVWQENKLDGLICPGLGTPAPTIDLANKIALGCCYVGIFNVLNMPAGSVPLTVAKEGEDCYPKELSKHTDTIFKDTAKSMKDSVGLPVAVQVCTLPHEEEKCIGIMMDLEQEARFAEKHPYPM